MSVQRLIDTVLDRTVLLGYSRPGYELRRLGWPGGGDLPRLDGHTVAVTGATSGLGEATAAGLYALGARVLLLVRSRERGEQLAERLSAGGTHAAGGSRDTDRSDGTDRIRVLSCDLSELASVRSCARTLLASGEGLDVLINNAGVMTSERSLSADGIELTFATNVLGPFLLTNLLRPALARGPRVGASRVINVSSGGMYGQRIRVDDLEMASEGYNGVTAYARSKRAQVILTELWAARWRSQRIGIHAMHPGWADTQGVRDALPRFHRLTGPLLRTPEQGADTTLWLAGTDPELLGTGGFWHDRRRRPTHLWGRTRETEQERVALWERLCELSGWDEATAARASLHLASGSA